MSSRPRFTIYLRKLSMRCSVVCVLVLCASCATLDKTPPDRRDNLIVLLNPELGIGEHWEHRRLRRGDTTYTQVESTFGYTVQATGNKSASILFRLFEPINLDCNTLRWSWYVQKPQQGSELHTKGKDDVAASVFVLFGDPGIFYDKPVPTLKYVWANDKHRKGEIITGPYHKKYIRTVIVRTGSSVTHELVTDRTNLSDDYLKAFDEARKDGIYGIAIFTDNDDTKEPIIAHYGRIDLLCNSE
jgi:hypothetical protein